MVSIVSSYRLFMRTHSPTKGGYYSLRRSYQTTQRNEIVPIIIGVGAIAVIGRYSWRAKQRMDEEWENYNVELLKYEKQMAQINRPRTICVDFGTFTSKMAITANPKSEIVVTREGDRSFFNGIIYEEGNTTEGDDHNDGNEDTAVRGRAALEKYYFETKSNISSVVSPWQVIDPLKTQQQENRNMGSKISGDVLRPVLTESIERINSNKSSSDATESNIRTVLSLPTPYLTSPEALSAISSALVSKGDDQSTIIVPNPVTAVWGAQLEGLIPETSDAKQQKIIVVDVGGECTQISVVANDLVEYNVALPWGGETLVKAAFDILLDTAKEVSPLSDARSLSALQIQARQAVTELSAASRVLVHVPYLFPDPGRHHLDTELSRPVLEQKINVHVGDMARSNEELPLSPHLPPPSSLETFLLSLLTETLEASQETPTSIDYLLLVGGASRAPLVESSLRGAAITLMGPEVASGKLVVPTSSLRSELVALGGTTILPKYTYDIVTGLVRVDNA